MNEKLAQVAHSYANMIREIVIAERKISKARSEFDNLLESKKRLALALREFVGANIRRKAVLLPGETVVTVEFISDNTELIICVFEGGEELAP